MTALRSPRVARLAKQFSIEPFGADITCLADINDDGRPEMLFLQSAGQLKSELYVGRTSLGVDDHDRALYCLTAVSLEGDVLWQDGTPDRRDMPHTTHGGTKMVRVEDIDGDGKPEVIVIRKNSLAILDGRTGDTRAETALPGDNFAALFTAQLGAPEDGRQILCKVNDKARAPWEYANPTIVYNSDLSVYHEPFAVRGCGHNVIAADLDDDGRDEVLIGYSLLDHDLSEVWRLDLGPDFDYAHEHADEISLSDPGNGEDRKIRYAGSENFYVVDLHGRMLWTAEAGHSQTSASGPWGPNHEKRVILCEKNLGLSGLDESGELLWTRRDINGYVHHDIAWPSRDGRTGRWTVFVPQHKPIPDVPYRSDPSRSHALWPRFMDGDGNLTEVFPWRDDYIQPSQLIRAKRSYDAGIKYNTSVGDVDGDGVEEVLVHDRRYVWIYHRP